MWKLYFDGVSAKEGSGAGIVEKCSKRWSSLVRSLFKKTSNCPQEIDLSCGELISSL